MSTERLVTLANWILDSENSTDDDKALAKRIGIILSERDDA